MEKFNRCIVPTPRSYENWVSKHMSNLNLAKMDHDVLLMGDSLIANLCKHPIWAKFQPLNAVNFGIGGDKIQNVLYRIKSDELSNKTTKIVVLMVGTNNTERDNPEQIFQGLLASMNAIEEYLPHCHIILPTMLPRGRFPNAKRRCLKAINRLLIRFGEMNKDSRRNIHIVSIHKNIVDKEGLISNQLLYDYLHPTGKGYEQIFEPIIKLIIKILAEKFNV